MLLQRKYSLCKHDLPVYGSIALIYHLAFVPLSFGFKGRLQTEQIHFINEHEYYFAAVITLCLSAVAASAVSQCSLRIRSR